jgi:hypothetical protein
MHRGTLLGVVGVSVLTGAAGLFLVAWSFTPPGPEAGLLASLDLASPAHRPATNAGRGASRPPGATHPRRANGTAHAARPPAAGSADHATDEKPARTIAELAREQNLDDEERAMLRRELREERLIDVNMRLDEYAAAEGWDPEMTDEIRDVLIDTADHITNVLGQVDRREVEWDAVKVDLWVYREQQAQKVRRAVGPSDFDHFVESMDFARFFGETPARGRVD